MFIMFVFMWIWMWYDCEIIDVIRVKFVWFGVVVGMQGGDVNVLKYWVVFVDNDQLFMFLWKIYCK